MKRKSEDKNSCCNGDVDKGWLKSTFHWWLHFFLAMSAMARARQSVGRIDRRSRYSHLESWRHRHRHGTRLRGKVCLSQSYISHMHTSTITVLPPASASSDRPIRFRSPRWEQLLPTSAWRVPPGTYTYTYIIKRR